MLWKTRLRFPTCLALVLLAPALCGAQAFLINFDTDMDGNVIPASDSVRTAYAGMGLIFSHTGQSKDGCNGAFANDNLPRDFGSQPNAISVCPSIYSGELSKNSTGLMRMSSEYDLASVCIQVFIVDPSDRGFIRAYDAGGMLIDEQFSTRGARGESLCVGGRRIRRVEFAGVGDDYALFDNLVVAGEGLGPIHYYLPAAANVNGYAGARWRTDLEVYNPNKRQVEVTVSNLPRNQGNSNPTTFSFDLPKGQSRRFINVLGNMFNYTGASTLRVAADFGPLITTSRSYNDADTGTYGQFIPGKTIQDAVGPGDSGRLIQLTQSQSDQTGYRTNIGIANLSDFTIETSVKIYSSDGRVIGVIHDTLLAYESVQYDRAMLPHIDQDIDDAYAIVWSSTPEAVFLPFATPVDNRTGDGFYFPAIVW